MKHRIVVLRLWLSRRTSRVLRNRLFERRRRILDYTSLGDGCSIGVLDRFYEELRR